MSDLHGHLPEIAECELVLICGDIIPLNIQGSSKKTYKWFSSVFKKWAENLPCRKVLFIAGNHELYLPDNYLRYRKLFPDNSKITYLCNDLFEYTGTDNKVYSIFGTPYCSKFGNWAFMYSNEVLEKLYSVIPDDLDILISHDQPYGYGDILLQEDCPWANGEHIGNKLLLKAIESRNIKVQLNGHLHSCEHSKIMIGNTSHYNVSIKDEKYQAVYSPLYLDILK